MRQDIRSLCSKCHVCQTVKRSSKKYGHLPPKEAEATPWDKLCVDLIGPYNFKTQTLWCVTMIDPATGWLEMKEIDNKEAINIANIVEQTWFTRYPLPTTITYDKGTEFMKEFAQMVQLDYGVEINGTSVRNPQANAVLE